MNLWPNQIRGIDQSVGRFEKQLDALIVASTGAGKSIIIERIVEHVIDQGLSSAIYVSRTMLLEQLRDGFRKAGHDPSIFWAGAKKGEFNPDASIHLCMTPTVASRCFGAHRQALPHAQHVFFDEPHMQSGNTSMKIIAAHRELGLHSLMGTTATPLGLKHIWNKSDIVLAGSNPELRECGSQLMAKTFSPSTIEVERHVKRNAEGEYIVDGETKLLWTQSVAGNIVDNIGILNPSRKPMICFGPDLASCRWLCDHFRRNGIRAAHIDGGSCYFEGEEHHKRERHRFVAMLRNHEIDMLVNRFVFREGVDIPELYHLIFATPIGSINAYVQSGGRVIRNSDTLNDHVVIQDHGGNYYRHGSINEDRTKLWLKYFDLGQKVCSDERRRLLSESGGDAEDAENGDNIPVPITCPHCDFESLRLIGGLCPNCHADLRHQKPRRRVVQSDGTLRDVERRPKPVRTKLLPDTAKLWERTFWSHYQSGKSFRQAYSAFRYNNGYNADKSVPFMPKNKTDWYLKVNQVDLRDLIPKP